VDEEPSLSQGSSHTAIVDDQARQVWAADNVSICARAAAEAAEKGSAALRGWPFELHFALLAAGYHEGLKWSAEHVRRPLSLKTPTHPAPQVHQLPLHPDAAVPDVHRSWARSARPTTLATSRSQGEGSG